jgi:sugar lactone lactonase YvrE
MFAAFAVAQNSAPTGAILVTGQNYPQVRHYSAAAGLARGPQTVAITPFPYGVAVALGRGGALLLRPDMPERVVQPDLSDVESNDPYSGFLPFSYVAGTGHAGFSGDGGAATSAEIDLHQSLLAMRSGLAIAPDGTVYLADTKNATIRAVSGAASSEPGVIRSVAGRWAPAQNVKLIEPMGVAVDRDGNLYIADHAAGTVSVLTKATGTLTVLVHVASPASVAVTADGSKVFVASPETGGVFSFSTLTHALATLSRFAPVAANSDGARSSPCAALESNAPAASLATSASAAARAICPAGLAVDGAGNLFVADAVNGNILRVDAATNKTTEAVVGMLEPGDIAFDSAGDLFASEQGRSRVIAMGGVGDASGSLSLTAPAPPAGCPQGASFTYCNEPTAGTSSSFAFTVRNTSAITVSNIVITPAFVPAGTNPPPAPTNFTTTSTSCTGTLTAGSSCVINVAFTPLTPGPLVAALMVTDGIPADTVSLNLSGTGDDFSLAIAPGTPPEQTVAQGSTATWNAQLTSDSVFGAEGEKVTLACPTNLPIFTSCEFTPCPLTPTVGGATTFSILVHTSTANKETPPISNPCNSTQPSGRIHSAVRAGVLTITPAGPGGGGSRFPTLLAVVGALALLTFGYFAMPSTAAAVTRRAFVAGGMVLLAGVILAACHKNNAANSTATPIAVTIMNVTASAVDSSGNSLHASRGVQITLDVIKQTGIGPLP